MPGWVPLTTLSGTKKLVGLEHKGCAVLEPVGSRMDADIFGITILFGNCCTQKVNVAGKKTSAVYILLGRCVCKEQVWDGNAFSLGRVSQGIAFCLAEPVLSHSPSSKKSFRWCQERGARTFKELLGPEAQGAAEGAGWAGDKDGVCWEKGARQEVSPGESGCGELAHSYG